MPLSRQGLWEAEMTTPAWKPWARARKATAGVGTMPALATRAPALRRPAASVAAIQGLDSRVSRPRRTVGLATVSLRREWARARPVAKMVVGSRGGSPATARMPSVPKSLRAVAMVIGSFRECGLKAANKKEAASWLRFAGCQVGECAYSAGIPCFLFLLFWPEFAAAD